MGKPLTPLQKEQIEEFLKAHPEKRSLLETTPPLNVCVKQYDRHGEIPQRLSKKTKRLSYYPEYAHTRYEEFMRGYQVTGTSVKSRVS